MLLLLIQDQINVKQRFSSIRSIDNEFLIVWRYLQCVVLGKAHNFLMVRLHAT